MRPFDVDDLYLHRKITDLHCVPGHDVAVCTVRSIEREKDAYRTHVWSFRLQGGPGQQLTHAENPATSPRLSPSGDRIAFLTHGREETIQVHLTDAYGGGAAQCGTVAGGVSSHRWDPDGSSLLVAGIVNVDPDARGRRLPGDREPAPGRPEVVWKLPYKSDGVGYMLAREIHLFRVDVHDGSHRQLTDGPFDVLAFDPSPDGRHVAHVRTRAGRFAHCTDLWVCDADGGHERQLTRDLATVTQPVWSPDGRRIAFAGAEREGDGQSWLYVFDFRENRLRRLGDDALEVAQLDEALHWSVDGTRLLFVRAHRGCHEVASIAPDGTSLQTLLAGDRQLGAFARTGEHLACSVEHPSLPSELHVARLDGTDERQVSDLNAWWKERTPLEAERRGFEVADGRGGRERIEGWLLRARGSAGPHPLLNDVHGGPASYALLDFDTNVFWQVLCSRGWAVLALNAVGSSSYGREFCSRLSGHWGELDLPQHLEAIRQLQAEGVCDTRVAISGKSYGGFLSAWAVGHTTVFKAAIVMAPVGNIETHYGTSDGGYYADPLYLDTAPNFDRTLARSLSPLQHVERAKTPTLFMQGKDDERCPKCQSEEMFVSLYRAGDTPAELVLYPGEDHHFLGEGSPGCRSDAANRIVAWLHQHVTGPAENEGSPAGSAESTQADAEAAHADADAEADPDAQPAAASR